MKFSTKATYGLKAVLHLADHYGQRSVAASQIAKQEVIPASYLEQILFTLKKKHWIKSLRGPSGGYVLAKKPSEIRVGSVLRDLEGAKFRGGKKEDLAKAKHTSLSGLASDLFWHKLTFSLSHFLDKTTLQDLMNEAKRFKKTRTHSPHLNFNI